jgi:hypothetical protein
MSADSDKTPVVTYSLTDFCTYARRLDTEETQDEYLQFVLTGETTNIENGFHQAIIDPALNWVEEDHPLDVTRDYDTLLGICANIPVQTPITVYPVANSAKTLTSSIHISCEVPTDEGVSPTALHLIL